MNRVLYAKYNSLRRPEYRVTTEIQEDEKGKRVVKKPGDAKAGEHIQTIARNRELLAGSYEKIKVLPVKREGDELVFPFVAGESLKDQIDTEKTDREAFVRQVTKLFDKILDYKKENFCPFEITEGFRALFGDIRPEETTAVCPANIDSLFSNFIENEEGIFCLDYEWVHDFPIPVNYIKYRTLAYLYNDWANSVFDGIKREELMSWFGLEESECEIYEAMESAFQQAVHGKDWRYMYPLRYNKKKENVLYMAKLIREKDQHIANLEKAGKGKDQHIANLEKAGKGKDQHISNLENMIRQDREAFNAALAMKNREIEDERNWSGILEAKLVTEQGMRRDFKAEEQRVKEIRDAAIRKVRKIIK